MISFIYFIYFAHYYLFLFKSSLYSSSYSSIFAWYSYLKPIGRSFSNFISRLIFFLLPLGDKLDSNLAFVLSGLKNDGLFVVIGFISLKKPPSSSSRAEDDLVFDISSSLRSLYPPYLHKTYASRPQITKLKIQSRRMMMRLPNGR